jgi:6-phosphogluconolactonase
MSAPEVVVHRSAELLARTVAARLVTRLVDAQATSSLASIVLTGGRIGTRVLHELRAAPARDAVDWPQVAVWWGDERFVPAADSRRNDRSAREALLDHVPVDAARVHPFPAAGERFGNDVDAAADAYAAELAAASRPQDQGDVPRFDVLMLGVGEDGHIASIFPEAPAAHDDRTVVAVRDAPKPPPTRMTMTFRALSAATEVWVIAAGEDKAAAVALALGGAGRVQVPAAGARGRLRTRWLLDRAAAAGLPTSVSRSPTV